MESESAKKQTKQQSALLADHSKLQHFFPKRIASVELLYRASDHQFCVQAFHRLCDGVDHTIVLLKTEHGNIIGGYSPNAWQSNRDAICDYKQESFLFSLTNGKKLQVTTQEHPIRNEAVSGPIFGNTDLVISDDANTEGSTSFYYPCDYGAHPDDKSVQSHITSFSGVPEGFYFKVEQWEVWKIRF